MTVTLRDASSADGNDAADSDLAKGDYYFTILPVTFEKGFSVILGMNDGTQKIVKRSSSVELDRNEIFRTQAVPASAYKAHVSNFVKYNDGFDLVYGSETVNIRDVNLKYATYVNDGRPAITSSGIFFVAPEAQNVTMEINKIDWHVVAGDCPSYRSSVQGIKSLQLQNNSTGFAVLADLNVNSAYALFGQGVTESRSIVIKNCKVVSTARYPLVSMTSAKDFALVNLYVEDSDILSNYTTNTSTPNFICIGASGQTHSITYLTIQNNVFQNICTSTSKKWTTSRITWLPQGTVTNLTFTNNTVVGMLHTAATDTGILMAKKYDGNITVTSNYFVDCQEQDGEPYMIYGGGYGTSCTGLVSGNMSFTEDMTKVMTYGNLPNEFVTKHKVRALNKYPLSEDWNPQEGIFGYQSGLTYGKYVNGEYQDEGMSVKNSTGAQRTTSSANLDTPSSGYGDNDNGSL